MEVEQLVRTAAQDAIGWITLNDPPKRNALSVPMARELTGALKRFWTDESIRAVVLRGTGGYFCAGGDVMSMKRRVDALREGRAPEADTRISMWALNEAILALRDIPKPVIAWIEGAAAGGGMSLAMACDFSLVQEDAKMVFAFAGVGMAPDLGSSVMAPSRVGAARAADLFMTGRRFTGAQAAQWGLVTGAWPAQELENEVRGLANRLAAGPARTYAEIKLALNRTMFAGLRDAMAQEVESAERLSRTADHAEAVCAFLEKRAPVFTGH